MLRTVSPLLRVALTALVVLGAAACSADRLTAPSSGSSADPVAEAKGACPNACPLRFAQGGSHPSFSHPRAAILSSRLTV